MFIFRKYFSLNNVGKKCYYVSTKNIVVKNGSYLLHNNWKHICTQNSKI